MNNLSGDNSIVEYPLFQTEDGGSIPTSPLQLLFYEIPIIKAIGLNKSWHSRLPIVDQSNIQRTTNNVCYGASFNNIYYAVAIWTTPIAQNRFADGKQMLELRRLAICDNAPKNTASRMLKIMRLMIGKKFPDIRRLISYQDVDVHTGSIYKADNWIATSTTPFIDWNTTNRRRNVPQSNAAKIRWEYLI